MEPSTKENGKTTSSMEWAKKVGQIPPNMRESTVKGKNMGKARCFLLMEVGTKGSFSTMTSKAKASMSGLIPGSMMGIGSKTKCMGKVRPLCFQVLKQRRENKLA